MMRFSILLTAFFVAVVLHPRFAFADDLAGTRLVCSGTTYPEGEAIDVSGWIIELKSGGEAFFEGVGRMHYNTFDTQVNLDWPPGCMATGIQHCRYYGFIKRSDGSTGITDNQINRAVFIGECVPFKPMF